MIELTKLHDYELEENVLGAVMAEPVAFEQIAPNWDESVFFKPQHVTIAWAITALFKSNKQIDLLTVSSYLKASNKLDEIGGVYYLTQLDARFAGTYRAVEHFNMLRELWLLRKLSSIGHELKVSTLETLANPHDIIEAHINKISSLTKNSQSNGIVHISKLNDEAITRLENINSGNLKSGIFTGFTKIDNHIGGWQRTELTILAARPGMGKTALALQFLIQPALIHRIPTLLFSIEMGANPILSRVQSILTGHSANNLIKGNVTADDIKSVKLGTQALYNNCPVYIDCTPGISVYDFRQKARQMKKEKGIELIIVDYLQLMKAGIKGNREQEISTISRTLKETAKELDIPIIALSQLSRDVEKRGGSNRPQLSDLRESGAIEQDADMVIFINRPEYYDKTEFEDGADATGQAELIISKNRNGSCGFIRVGFEAANVRFYDLEKTKLEPNTEF